MCYQQVSTLVQSVLQKHNCCTHQLPLTHYQHGKVVCQKCVRKDGMLISQLVENPMLMMEGMKEYVRDGSSYGVLKNKNHIEHIEQTVGKVLEMVERRVKELCEKIKSYFSQKWESCWMGAVEEWETVLTIQENCREGFEHFLDQYFIQGTPEELQTSIKEFLSRSENPLERFQPAFQRIKTCVEELPFVQWDKLQALYEGITDPIMWDPFSLICTHQSPQSPRQSERVLVPNLPNRLADGIHYLSYGQGSIQLLQEEAQPTLDSLDCWNQQKVVINSITAEVDNLTQMSGYRIVGYNYKGIYVYSYGWGRLKLQNEFKIEGCTHVLYNPICLIVIAEGRLIRVWLGDKKEEILGLNYYDLEYGSSVNSFICINSVGSRENRCFYHN